jgi:hypothetical protein
MNMGDFESFHRLILRALFSAKAASLKLAFLRLGK